MNNTLKNNLTYIVFAIFLIISSCGIFKNNTNIKNTNELTESEKIIDTIVSNYLNYKTLLIKYSANYKTDKQSINFSGTIRMVKDSAMLITVSPGFGIELGRVLITNDSVMFYNNFNNSYLKEDKSYFEKSYGLDLQFSTLEAILTNKIFTYPATNKISDYKYSADSLNYLYSFLRKHPRNEKLTDFKHEFKIDKQTYSVKQHFIEDNVNFRGLNVNYTDFLYINNSFFPEKFSISLKEKQKHELSFSYKKVMVDKSFKLNLKIPKNAKQIE